MSTTATAFEKVGKAATVAAEAVMELGESFRGWADQIAAWQEQQAGALALSQVGSPYPTQSGGEAGRSAPTAPLKMQGYSAHLAYMDEATLINPG